jgi:chemotaxis protein MotA
VDPASLIGVVVALAGIFTSMIMEGSSPTAIILIPPMILVFLGTFGAGIAGSSMADVTKLGGWFKLALMPPKVPPATERIGVLVSLAEKARKEGLLALEAEVKNIDDPFLKRGLQMGIDGTDPEVLRSVLEGEIAAKKAEDKVAAKFFTGLGGYAPTIGIIGTVIGLIHVLENLNDPGKLGPLIASAFVATLWGVMTANVFWLPFAAKITRTSARAVRQKLAALVPPSENKQQEAA